VDERELIAWLRKQIKREIPADVIERLRQEGLLHAEDGTEQRDALKRTRNLLKLNPSGGPRSRKRLPQTSESELRNLARHDVLRRDALSEYWAMDAGTRIEVKRFRAGVLRGRLLAPVKARRFLETSGDARETLSRVAGSLRYPWQPGEAEWFILTGEIPRVPALGHSFGVHVASHGNRAVIHIDVEPWVSAERVTALYRDLQKAILRNRHNRPISERRLTLFRFVTEHADDEGEIAPWRALLPEWNRRHKRWTYRNVRNFSRDYWAVARLLLFPTYNLNTGGSPS
jgi:hypothetical protein